MNDSPPPAPVAPPPRYGPLWALLEGFGVLLATLGAIISILIVLMVVLAPPLYTLSFPLETRAGGPAAGEDARLLDRLEQLDLRGAEARLSRSGDRASVVIEGADSIDGLAPLIEQLLFEAGYTSGPSRVSQLPDAVEFISARPGLVFGVQTGFLLGVGALMIAWRVRPNATRLPAWRAALIGVSGGLVAFPLAVLIGLTQNALGLEMGEQEWLIELLGRPGMVARLLPWVVLVAPVAEETFFRGYLFRFFDGRIGSRAAYVISAAAFSAIHMHVPGLAVYFAVGLIFAWVCRRTGGLLAPAISHVVYNGVAFAVLAAAPLS